MISIEEICLFSDEKEKWLALLSCLCVNRWCPMELEVDQGETIYDPGRYYVWYEDTANKTLYTLQYEGDEVPNSEHFQGTYDLRASILSQGRGPHTHIDQKPIPQGDLIAILYFLCMRAGVLYEDTYDIDPDIGLDSDDVYTRNSSQIEGTWNICELNEVVNIWKLDKIPRL